MIKSIDARFFFLLPSDQDRERINQFVKREICELFILDNVSQVKPLLVHQDKSILILDYFTFPEELTLDTFCSDILATCGEKLLRVFIVGTPPEKAFKRKEVSHLSRNEVMDNQQLKSIIDEMNIWGLRSYIRFGSQNSRIAVFRMKFIQGWRTGVIHDISASGMSCSFDRYDDIDVSDKSSTIEIIINEQKFSLEGNFLLRRTFKNSNMFVLVFSSRRGGINIVKLNSIIFTLTRQDVLEKIEKLAAR